MGLNQDLTRGEAKLHKAFCTQNESGTEAFQGVESPTESRHVAKVVGKNEVFNSPLACPTVNFSL